MTEYYGSSPLSWGDVIYYRLAPTWMVVFASDPGKLLGGDGTAPRTSP